MRKYVNAGMILAIVLMWAAPPVQADVFKGPRGVYKDLVGQNYVRGESRRRVEQRRATPSQQYATSRGDESWRTTGTTVETVATRTQQPTTTTTTVSDEIEKLQPLPLNKEGITLKNPAARMTVIDIGAAPVNPNIRATGPNQRIVVNRYNVPVETDMVLRNGATQRVGTNGDKFIPAGQFWLVDLDVNGAVNLRTAKPIVCGNNILTWFALPEFYDADTLRRIVVERQITTPPPTDYGDGQRTASAPAQWSLAATTHEATAGGNDWLTIPSLVTGVNVPNGQWVPATCVTVAKTSKGEFYSNPLRKNIDGFEVDFVQNVVNIRPKGARGEHWIECTAYGKVFRSEPVPFDLQNPSLCQKYRKSCRVGGIVGTALFLWWLNDRLPDWTGRNRIPDGPDVGPCPDGSPGPPCGPISPPNGNPNGMPSGNWDDSVVFNPYTPPTNGGNTTGTPVLPPGANPNQPILPPTNPGGIPDWIPEWGGDPPTPPNGGGPVGPPPGGGTNNPPPGGGTTTPPPGGGGPVPPPNGGGN